MFKKGNTPWNKGVPMSNDTKEKLSNIKKGTKHSKETIQKIISANTGKKRNKKFREKMREINLGRKLSKEHRKKISHSNLGKTAWNSGLKGYLAGIKSPHWVKDRSELRTDRRKAYDSRYKIWMKEVKDRDEWKCRIDNDECSGRLEAHHILPWSKFPELRYNINNGISLCHYHHPKSRNAEKRLAMVFKKIVVRPINKLAHNN